MGDDEGASPVSTGGTSPEPVSKLCLLLGPQVAVCQEMWDQGQGEGAHLL